MMPLIRRKKRKGEFLARMRPKEQMFKRIKSKHKNKNLNKKTKDLNHQQQQQQQQMMKGIAHRLD